MSLHPVKLGKYEIVRALGEGAMGTVYEAVDRVIERTVAIKTIRRSALDPDEAAEHDRRFLVEAKAAGKLNHPNIVALYDHGEEAGMAYIVMELVQGRELQRYFDAKVGFALADTVRLMGELLGALGYSHRRGVVHRDVKPANIFITDTGSVKLGDFGIARIESSQKTRVGSVVGTPSYMAPEQIRGEPVDARADLYAAGVVLYQFLTGERPYSGNMLTMALKVLNDPVPRASEKNPEVGAALDAVVLKALAKQADERYASAAEFWQALASAVGMAPAAPVSGFGPMGGDSVLPGAEGTWAPGLRTDLGRTPEPADAEPTLRTARVAVAAPRVDEGRDGRAEAPRRPRHGASPVAVPTPATTSRRRGLWWAAAGVAVMGVGGGAWWLVRRRPGAPPVQATPAPAPAPPPPPPAPPVPVPVPAPVPPPAPAPAPVPAPSPPAIAPPAATPGPAAAPTPPAPTAPAPRPPAAAPRPAPRPPAPPPAQPQERPARPARCSDILQKASLEPLSAEEAAFLRKECR